MLRGENGIANVGIFSFYQCIEIVFGLGMVFYQGVIGIFFIIGFWVLDIVVGGQQLVRLYLFERYSSRVMQRINIRRDFGNYVFYFFKFVEWEIEVQR